VLTGEQPANTPATTTLALIEQGLRAFTAIYKRIHRSLKKELQLLFELNAKYLEEDVSYKVGDAWKTITRADYSKGAGVEPVSDPSQVSDMQKLGRSQFLLQFANDPIANKKEILTRAFHGASIEKIEALFNPNPQPDPKTVEAMLKLTLKEKHDQALIEREQASALLMRAQGILALTAADKNLVGIDVSWAQHQLEIVKTGLEALGQGVSLDLPSAGEPGGMPGAPPPNPGGGPDLGGHPVSPAPTSLQPPTPAPSTGGF
jgi:chaperonin GroES